MAKTRKSDLTVERKADRTGVWLKVRGDNLELTWDEVAELQRQLYKASVDHSEGTAKGVADVIGKEKSGVRRRGKSR